MSERVIEEAAEALRAGRLVALPTETVYGLGVNALDVEAVARVFEAKGRPRFDPLIVHAADRDAARGWAGAWPEAAERLAAHFWPGPLTLVLPKDQRIPDLVTAGLPSVGLRVPDHPLTRELLRRADVPVAAPSANRFGGISPTTAEHVRAELGDAVDFVVDGGPCRAGLESTVISLLEERPRLLRPGSTPVEEIEELVGELASPPHATPVRPGGLQAPGLTSRHYAPKTPLELVDGLDEARQRARGRRAGLLLCEGGAPEGFERVEALSPSGDLRAAAAGFFAALRRLDDSGLDVILALQPAPEGWGLALADRLRRASATDQASPS